MDLIELLAPSCVQMLGSLDRWLDKAERARTGAEADALMAMRLAPDMFPLATQVRFACVQALEGMARLRGEPFPELAGTLRDEGRDAGESPGSIADARHRIAGTLERLRDAGDRPDGGEHERPLAHELPNGMVFDFTAAEYVRDWAMPQFYFHLMAAYAILRHAGIELGKADYVSHLFGKLRPGTAPAG